MYTVRQAKTNFSKLLEEAQKGNEVIIARGKTPIAKLVALGNLQKRRKPGKYKDVIKIHPSFYDRMSTKELKDWGLERLLPSSFEKDPTTNNGSADGRLLAVCAETIDLSANEFAGMARPDVGTVGGCFGN